MNPANLLHSFFVYVAHIYRSTWTTIIKHYINSILKSQNKLIIDAQRPSKTKSGRSLKSACAAVTSSYSSYKVMV